MASESVTPAFTVTGDSIISALPAGPVELVPDVTPAEYKWYIKLVRRFREMDIDLGQAQDAGELALAAAREALQAGQTEFTWNGMTLKVVDPEDVG